jgi:hypothetical protein
MQVNNKPQDSRVYSLPKGTVGKLDATSKHGDAAHGILVALPERKVGVSWQGWPGGLNSKRRHGSTSHVHGDNVRNLTRQQ